VQVLADEENVRKQREVKKACWLAIIPMPRCVLDVSEPNDQKQDLSSWALFLGGLPVFIPYLFSRSSTMVPTKKPTTNTKRQKQGFPLPCFNIYLVCLVCPMCPGQFSLHQLPHTYSDQGNLSPFLIVF